MPFPTFLALVLMKIITWNIRGLKGSLSKQNEIRRMIQVNHPHLVFLQETKMSMEDMDSIASKTWPAGKVVSLSSQGTSGGIACLWDPKEVVIHHMVGSWGILAVAIQSRHSNQIMLCITVYAPTTLEEKRRQWKNITHIISHFPEAWILIGGDFNTILSLNEKMGGNRNLDKSTDLMNEYISNLHLVDIQPDNGLMTWSNRRKGLACIMERLDRFLLSEDFLIHGHIPKVKTLNNAGSDHWPVMVEMWKTNVSLSPFRFQLMWLRDSSFRPRVQQWWKEGKPRHGTKMFCFAKRLHYIKSKIKTWNWKEFGDVHKKK